MSFILSSISSIANYVLKDLQFSELNVTIQNKLDEVLSVYQSMIEQIYINADIASIKYATYNRGLRRTIVGFIFFVVLLLIGIYIY